MILDDQINRLVDESVLCWLATCSAAGQPSVSPKEIFALFGADSIVIANIASPNSARNIRENPRVCVSLVNVFTQRGYQLKGSALDLREGDEGFEEIAGLLRGLTGGLFPFRSVFRVQVKEAREIIAPRYRLFPETTERDQVNNAMAAYGVRPRA